MMNLKNTYKSKILEKSIDKDTFYAFIDNHTSFTDTISKKIDKRFIQFYFCIGGKITFHFSDSYTRVLSEGSSFMLYNPAKDLPLQISMLGGSQLHIVVISISNLHSLLGTHVQYPFLENTQQNIYEEHTINISLAQFLAQLQHNPPNVSIPLENIYFKAKIMELLVLYFSLREGNTEECPYLSNTEIAQKIKKAKEIITVELSTHFKIKDLALEVDLSTYKLKEGFKALYGVTISQYVLQQKMNSAKHMIESRKYKIKEIANELGYENPSHFITAYKKKFGITPKQYQIQIY